MQWTALKGNGLYFRTTKGSPTMLNWSRLPQDIRQGDVLRQTDKGFVPDPEETARRRERVRRLEERLRQKR